MSERRGSCEWRSAVAVVVAASVVAVGATSCAAPSGGGTVTQGIYSGQYSITGSPVTYGYDGVAGEDLNLNFADNRSGEMSTPQLSLVAPDGATVPVSETRGSYTKRYQLPSTGRYIIRMRYPDLDTLVRTYFLVVSRDEDRGEVGLGPIGPVLAGQRVTVHYSGQAGERLNRFAVDRVQAPDGQLVPDNGLRFGQVTLPTTGSYSLETARADAVLSHDLPPIPVALGATVVPGLVSGQHVDLLYAGTAGEAIGIAAPYSSSSVELRSPDDSPVSSSGVRHVLPATATHRVAVTRRYAGSLATTVWITHDLDLGVVGEGLWAAPSRMPGQSVALTWPGVAGQSFRIRTFDPPGLKPQVTVTSPNGTGLSGVSDPVAPATGDRWTTFTPTQSGEHAVLVVPRSTEDSGPISVEFDALP